MLYNRSYTELPGGEGEPARKAPPDEPALPWKMPIYPEPKDGPVGSWECPCGRTGCPGCR